MRDSLMTVMPIFAVIAAGWVVRRKQLVSTEFLESGNRLVFYLAIPAMVFRAIAKTSVGDQLNPTVLLATLSAILLVYLGSWGFGRAYGLPRHMRATFVQTTTHGNLGYIGLAVAYYYLGSEGLARASLMLGFIAILQNLLSVVVLQVHAGERAESLAAGRVVLKILCNPVILSAMAGILAAAAAIELPVFADRVLQIVGSLALPLALLIIGGSLSFHLPRGTLLPVIFAVAVKLAVLPAAGLGLFALSGVAARDYLPALILLATPTATVTYVMARELHGDTEFAVMAISLCTLASAVTYALWLHLAG